MIQSIVFPLGIACASVIRTRFGEAGSSSPSCSVTCFLPTCINTARAARPAPSKTTTSSPIRIRSTSAQ